MTDRYGRDGRTQRLQNFHIAEEVSAGNSRPVGYTCRSLNPEPLEDEWISRTRSLILFDGTKAGVITMNHPKLWQFAPARTRGRADWLDSAKYFYSAARMLILKWNAIILASLMPILAGLIVGTVRDPLTFQISDIENTVIWIAYPLAMVAPVGFAIWLAWRSPFSRNRWSKLAVCSALLAPSSLLTSSIVEWVSFFLHFKSFEVFDPNVSFSTGATIVDEAIPDALFFISLVVALSAARQLLRISLVRADESAKQPTQITIHSMLTSTLLVSFIFLAVSHELRLNRDELAKLDFPHGTFTWMDVLGFVTPLSSAASTAIAVCLLAFVSTARLRQSVMFLTLAFGALLIPSILEKQAFHWINFGPTDSSILPHFFDVVGASSILLVCSGCLGFLRRTGLRIEFGRTRRKPTLSLDNENTGQ